MPIANSLLAALPGKDYWRLQARLEPVTLTFGEVLYRPGEPIRHVYFPTNALVSLLTPVEGHMALEIGLVGREGMLGIPLAYKNHPRVHISELAREELEGNAIAVLDHCYGCTAGQGSSCGGALG